MKRIWRLICLACALLIQPTHLGASDLRQLPAVVTDVPEVVDLSYASPENWLSLPPVDGNQRPPSLPLLPAEVDFPVSLTELAELRWSALPRPRGGAVTPKL
jgi:hypothetical protein